MTTTLSPAARAAGLTPAEQDAACHDVSTAVSPPKEDGTADEICAFNIIWARVTGLVDTPGEYVNFTGLNENSTEADFQCTLYAKTVGAQEGDGHDCTKPCSSTFPQCGTPTTTVGPQASDSSFPLWAGMLIGLILIGIIGAVAYFMMQKEEKPKKKKRALKVAPPPPPPAPVATTPVVVHRAAPVHTMVAPPIYVQHAQAAPVTYAAPSVQYAAPSVQTISHPVTYAHPQTYSASAPYDPYAAPQMYAQATTQ